VDDIEGGKGDIAFKEIFYSTMYEMCDHNSTGLRDAVYHIL